MPHRRLLFALLATFAPLAILHAQAPAASNSLNYQGRMVVNGLNFTGSGQFKFAIMDGVDTALWTSTDDADTDGVPDTGIAIPVVNGLYSTLLGDTAAGMLALPANIFSMNADTRLRVWFNDGTIGWQRLDPDDKIGAVAYALSAKKAETVGDGAITMEKLALGAVGADQIAPGSITTSLLNVVGAPSPGQVLGFDGANFSWITGGAGGGSLALPFSGIASSAGALFSVNNSNPAPANAWAIYGHSQNSIGVFGQTHGDSSGVLGRAEGPTGQAVFGYSSDSAIGVLGLSEYGDGIIGTTHFGTHNGVVGRNDEPQTGIDFDGGAGVFGYASYDAIGVQGISERGDGVVGRTNRVNAFGGRFLNTAGGAALKVEGRLDLNGVLSQHEVIHGNDWNIFFRGIGDSSHGVGWHGVGKPWAGVDYDGPVLWGWAGGALGTTNGGQKTALSWDTTGNVKVKTLTILGGADLAEPFAMSEEKVEPGSVVVIDESSPGRLRRSTHAYDAKVAGVVSGARGIHPGISMIQEDALEAGKNVALSGRVYVKADASGGAIHPGDMLTTSETPGRAMRARDRDRAAGAVLGKAMSSLEEGEGEVLVLVTLQ